MPFDETTPPSIPPEQPQAQQPGETFGTDGSALGEVPTFQTEDEPGPDHNKRADLMESPIKPDYAPVPTVRPDLTPQALSGSAAQSAAPAAESVTHIPVVEHTEEHHEEPSATQSLGLPPETQTTGTSLMDRLSENEPTAGPEDSAVNQPGNILAQAKEAPVVSGEKYIHEEKMAEAMAHSEDKFRTEASLYKTKAKEAEAGGDEVERDANTFMANRMEGFAEVEGMGARHEFETENGPSIDTLREQQRELHKKLESQADDLKQTIERLKDVNQKLADKQESTSNQTPPAPDVSQQTKDQWLEDQARLASN